MIKKNQIVIFAIAVMLIAAGYLNYRMGDKNDAIETSNPAEPSEIAGLGDAKLVNGNAIDEDENSRETSRETRTCK